MEFDEIDVKVNPGICRCCLSEGCYKELSSEYSWMTETEVYADMLLDCFDISISQHNEGPNGAQRLICEVCITRLRDACNFKKQVLESEKKFVDMLSRGDFRPKVMVFEDSMKEEKHDEDIGVINEVEVEYLDEDMDYVDDTEYLQTETDIDQPSVSKDTTSKLQMKVKRGRPRKSPELKPEKKIKVTKTKVEEKIKKSAVKDERPDGGRTSARMRNNLQILFNSTTITPFKWRGRCICFYCGKHLSEYKDFRKHTKSHAHCSTTDGYFKRVKGSVEIKIDVSEISCEICTEPFANLDEIVTHLVGKHKMKYDVDIFMPYQAYRLADRRCLFCEAQFDYFGTLISHMNHFHPQNSFICDECGSNFNKKRDLASHIRRYHRIGEFTCAVCSQNFECFNMLDRHKKKYHASKCKYCSAVLLSYSLLQKHVKLEHPDGGKVQCTYCLQDVGTTQGLTFHLQKCNTYLMMKIVTDDILPNKMPKIKKNTNVQQIRLNIQTVLNMTTALPFKYFSKYGCFYCSKKFVEIDDLREHTNVEHTYCDLKSKSLKRCKGERSTIKVEVSSLSCKVCCRTMDNLAALTDHLILKHDANYDKTIECFETYHIAKDNMPCPVCSKIFKYFGLLLRHMNSEHSNNKIICDVCGTRFRNSANLQVHITYNHSATCECNTCGAKFRNQSCLSRHRASVHNVTEYKCSKCTEKFKSNYQMAKHMIKAHDIGHKCSYCDKMFTRNSFMKDHIRRTHLKEKNVPCSICNEKFFDNYLLRMHMVKHDGERKFTCDVCGKAFLRRSNLRSHMDVHKKYGQVQPLR